MQKIVDISDYPFHYVIVDDFLDKETLDAVLKEYPAYDSDVWNCRYDSPIEKKRGCNDWNKYGPAIYSLFQNLTCPKFTKKMESLFGESNLIPDRGLHGGGLHIHKTGDKLNIHLDYSKHPKLNLKRKVNLIVYLTPDWNPEWGGGLELWSHDSVNNKPKERIVTIENKFNRAIIFDVSDHCWHGFPEPITCPENVNRRSAAVYYLKDEEDLHNRRRALCAPTKEQESDPEVLEIIRKRAE